MKAEQNPFRSSAVAELRYRMESGQRRELVERLRINSWRGCILGPEGTGKTTLLEDLEAPVRAEGVAVAWIRLTLDSTATERKEALKRLAGMGAGECGFFDGGEILGWLCWRRVIRTVKTNGCGLVATVHRRCPLPVVHRTKSDSSVVLSLAQELAGAHWTGELEAAAREAFRRSHGNAREVFRACYWSCASRLH